MSRAWSSSRSNVSSSRKNVSRRMRAEFRRLPQVEDDDDDGEIVSLHSNISDCVIDSSVAQKLRGEQFVRRYNKTFPHDSDDEDDDDDDDDDDDSNAKERESDKIKAWAKRKRDLWTTARKRITSGDGPSLLMTPLLVKAESTTAVERGISGTNHACDVTGCTCDVTCPLLPDHVTSHQNSSSRPRAHSDLTKSLSAQPKLQSDQTQEHIYDPAHDYLYPDQYASGAAYINPAAGVC